VNRIRLSNGPEVTAATPPIPVRIVAVMVMVGSFDAALAWRCHGMRFNVRTDVMTTHRLMM
jgi:hypothetical protein